MPSKTQIADEVRARLTKAQRRSLHRASRLLNQDSRKRLGMTMRCPYYPQDPLLAGEPGLEIAWQELRWEPGLGDGPTSARIAVVDYNVDTDQLHPPARFRVAKNRVALPDRFCLPDDQDTPIDEHHGDQPQFRQVNVWTVVRSVLDYYEDPRALARPVPWGFDGNRLIVVPAAGYAENAYYDRHSKSLQFYFYGDPNDLKYTCLSHDIVAHETGHAILDGIRPYYYEQTSLETGAFHEYVADLTAILMALRNEKVRAVVAAQTAGNLDEDKVLAPLARQLGEATNTREHPYVRTARNQETMSTIAGTTSPHTCSQVLTGAMFELLNRLSVAYLERKQADGTSVSPRQALFWACERFGRQAIQPLDLCPPADIQFVDYARAVLHNSQLVDPVDPHGYRDMMRDVFHERGLCRCREPDSGIKACTLSPPELPRVAINHDQARIAGSRTGAYAFLHDHRKALAIPAHQDVVVTDLYETNKRGRAAVRLPREIVIVYLWRETVTLEGAAYGPWHGQTLDLLCGGTLVFDDRGNLRSWFYKPGTELVEDRSNDGRRNARHNREGRARRDAMRTYVAGLVRTGRLGLADEVDADLGVPGPPVVAVSSSQGLRLEMTPALRDLDDDGEGEPWTTSF